MLHFLDIDGISSQILRLVVVRRCEKIDRLRHYVLLLSPKKGEHEAQSLNRRTVIHELDSPVEEE